MRQVLLFTGILGLMFLARTAAAETKVTISDTHLCCGQCLRAVDATLKDMAGVKHTSSQQAKTIEIVADNDEAAQKAIDALAAAGFYGKLNNDKLKYKPVASADSNVTKLELGGIHNCCGQCTTAIKNAITKVNGVTGTDIANRKTEFAVEGNFKPGDVVKALLDAGFYVLVKKLGGTWPIQAAAGPPFSLHSENNLGCISPQRGLVHLFSFLDGTAATRVQIRSAQVVPAAFLRLIPRLVTNDTKKTARDHP